MKKWLKRLGFGALIAVVGGAIMFVSAIWYTNRSDFCTTCHYMQPYYDAWASSSHSMVPCRDCHYEPGYSSVVKGKLHDINQLVKYWTKAYQRSKPWAEISDASCLRPGCHDHRLLEGQVKFGRVNFDHGPHLKEMRRGKKLRCTSCHSQIVQGDHMTVTQSTCILCHFTLDEEGQNLADCTICHDPPVATPDQDEPPKYDHTRAVENQLECSKCHGSMVVGDGAVPRERCYACHWEQERLDLYHNTDLMHAKHITESKIECDRCHLSMQHKSVSHEKAMPECQTCHADFHHLQKDLYVGHGGIGVPDIPNPMYKRKLSCQGCHIFHLDTPESTANGDTFIASGESCEPCHGEGYNRLLANWNKAAEHKMKTVSRALNAAEKMRHRSTAPEIDSLLIEARYNYDMVHEGRPIHNIVYANDLLDVAHDRLAEFFAQVAPDYQLESIEKSEKVVPSACVNCHIGIEDIDAQIFGLTYSHKKHVVDQHLACTQCHSHQRFHGELVVQRADCLSCHHSQEARDCDYCHEVQAATMRGDSRYLPLEDADIMYAAEVSCRDCHELPNREIARPVAQRCADCHDKDYPEMQREWLAEFAALVGSVENRLAAVELLAPDALRDSALVPARRHLQYIEADGSRGSHNHFEQMRVLEDDLTRLENLLAEGR